MHEISRRHGRQQHARPSDAATMTLWYGRARSSFGLGVARPKIWTRRSHGHSLQTRSSSSSVPNRPHGRMLITTSKMRNGTASLRIGSISRTVRYCASATMNAPTTAPRRLSRPPTSAAVSPASPMVTLSGLRNARAEQHAGERCGDDRDHPREREDKFTLTPRWLASSGFSAAAAELHAQPREIEEDEERGEKGDVSRHARRCPCRTARRRPPTNCGRDSDIDRDATLRDCQITTMADLRTMASRPSPGRHVNRLADQPPHQGEIDDHAEHDALKHERAEQSPAAATALA